MSSLTEPINGSSNNKCHHLRVSLRVIRLLVIY